MTDDRELLGLDPFDLRDAEAERLDAFFSGSSVMATDQALRAH